jgi:hypothetical protein
MFKLEHFGIGGAMPANTNKTLNNNLVTNLETQKLVTSTQKLEQSIAEPSITTEPQEISVTAVIADTLGAPAPTKEINESLQLESLIQPQPQASTNANTITDVSVPSTVFSSVQLLLEQAQTLNQTLLSAKDAAMREREEVVREKEALAKEKENIQRENQDLLARLRGLEERLSHEQQANKELVVKNHQYFQVPIVTSLHSQSFGVIVYVI